MRHYIIFAIIVLSSAFLHANAEIVNVHFDKSLLEQKEKEGEDKQTYVQLLYEDLDMLDYIGGPTLPVKYINVKVPHNAKDISISVKKEGCSTIQLNSKIYPVQMPEPTSTDYCVHEFTTEDNTIYGSKKGYPDESCRITDISSIGKSDKYVGLAICPLQYFPIEDRCEFTENFQIEINYTSSQINPLVVPTDYNPTHVPFYEYCIITNATLEEGFTRLVAWIREKGVNAGVVRVEDILDDPTIIGDTVSCLYDDAGKIRQYLQYAYTFGGTRYVLFGGNDSILPIRYGSGYGNTQTPTDFYFSELNSNWNSNGDNYLGEENSSMDYASELQVGRLLCTNVEQIKNYSDKLLRYELNPGNGNHSYLSKIFCSQADQMQTTTSGGITGQANIITSYVQDIFTNATILSEYPGADNANTTFPTGNDIIATMNQNFGYVSWFNHGNPTSITAKSNNYGVSPYGMASICGNIPWIEHETANGLDSLKNKNFPMIAYSVACDITPFDAFDTIYAEFPNIGQSFTLGKNYGGPALIGNTRQGFVYHSYLVQKLFNQNMRYFNIQ